MPEHLPGSALAAAQLAVEGVDTVFAIPGVHNVHLCDALLDQPGIDVFTGRHEQGLGFMANGYTRASGRIAVPLVISGPGVTNVLTALADAYVDSVPMVLIAAGCDTRYLGKGAFHELRDQTQSLASVTKWNGRADQASEVPDLIRTAFEQARAGRPGPTAVEIPMDTQTDLGAADIRPSNQPPRFGADAPSVEDAATRLAAARTPVIYAGQGAVISGAGDELVALAERLDAPCVTTALAKGVMPETHQLSLGFGLRREPVRRTLTEADVVLVVGSSLDEAATDGWRLQLPDDTIQIDIAAEVIGLTNPVAVGLHGDAKIVLQQLLDRLGPELGPKGARRELLEGLRAEERAELRDDSGWQYMQAIQSTLADDGIVTNDAATANSWALKYLTRTMPRTLNITSNLGALGFALPAAVGAKVAFPDRQVLAIVGDGGFLFNDHALSTAVQHQLGVVTIVFNDNCYSSIKSQQQALFGRTVATDLVNPDFALLAAAYGARGAIARTPDELLAALEMAWEQPGPTVIEVPLP